MSNIKCVYCNCKLIAKEGSPNHKKMFNKDIVWYDATGSTITYCQAAPQEVRNTRWHSPQAIPSIINGVIYV